MSKKVEITKDELDKLLESQNELKKKKEKQRKYWMKREAKRSLLCNKALEAGITVSDKEIDEYLKNK